MGHPEIQNRTGFEFEPLYMADESGMPILTVIVKATYCIKDETSLELSEKQMKVNFGGEYWGDPDFSSYKYEPETAFVKQATDVVLIGHAYARKQTTKSIDVGIRVGPVQKVVRVMGDRFLIRGRGDKIYGPQPFERIPLIYERSFGGWDRSHSNPQKHKFEPRNPVGVGFGYPNGKTDAPIQLPNIEDPDRLWRGWGDRPPPAGFGFVSPHWKFRTAFAGTYGKKWEKTRKPLLPDDFDRRFFNAASPGLIVPGFLCGNEPVVIINASGSGRVQFNLPGTPPPRCEIGLRSRESIVLQTRLDTVIINTDEHFVVLLWRAYTMLPNGPHDVLALGIETKGKHKGCCC